MPSLREVQRVHRRHPARRQRRAAGLAIVAGDLDPQTRVAIYRNNILSNYRSAAATFRSCAAWSARVFDAATDQFVRGHPSRHGDVNRYGGDYATFLASYPPARGLGYLTDVARLEWAIDQANIAADAAPFDASTLAGVAPDALAEAEVPPASIRALDRVTVSRPAHLAGEPA